VNLQRIGGHTKRAHRPHWYFISAEQCVLCGREYVERERRYGKRPKKWADRHEYSEFACTSHFL
jgi:hypothetical protein